MNKFLEISIIGITLCIIECCVMLYSDIGSTKSLDVDDYKSESSITYKIINEYSIDTTSNSFDEIDLVDNEISTVLNSDQYKNSNQKEREDLISKILKDLEKEKLIKNLSYDNKNYLFSFQYVDNSLGGVQLQDFNAKQDKLFIN